MLQVISLEKNRRPVAGASHGCSRTDFQQPERVTLTRQVTVIVIEGGADAMEDVIDTSDVEEKEVLEAQKPGYHDRVWGMPNVCPRIHLNIH